MIHFVLGTASKSSPSKMCANCLNGLSSMSFWEEIRGIGRVVIVFMFEYEYEV